MNVRPQALEQDLAEIATFDSDVTEDLASFNSSGSDSSDSDSGSESDFTTDDDSVDYVDISSKPKWKGRNKLSYFDQLMKRKKNRDFKEEDSYEQDQYEEDDTESESETKPSYVQRLMMKRGEQDSVRSESLEEPTEIEETTDSTRGEKKKSPFRRLVQRKKSKDSRDDGYSVNDMRSIGSINTNKGKPDRDRYETCDTSKAFDNNCDENDASELILPECGESVKKEDKVLNNTEDVVETGSYRRKKKKNVFKRRVRRGEEYEVGQESINEELKSKSVETSQQSYVDYLYQGKSEKESKRLSEIEASASEKYMTNTHLRNASNKVVAEPTEDMRVDASDGRDNAEQMTGDTDVRSKSTTVSLNAASIGEEETSIVMYDQPSIMYAASADEEDWTDEASASEDSQSSQESGNNDKAQAYLLRADDPFLKPKIVDKQVTITSIGNLKKSEYLIKGAPTVPYHVPSIRPLLAPHESRGGTTPRFLVASPRNKGSVFQRIKPRPVLMDSKSPKNPANIRRETGIETYQLSSNSSHGENYKNRAYNPCSETSKEFKFRSPRSRTLETLRSRRNRGRGRRTGNQNDFSLQFPSFHFGTNSHSKSKKGPDSCEKRDKGHSESDNKDEEYAKPSNSDIIGDNIGITSLRTDLRGDQIVPSIGVGDLGAKEQIISKETWRKSREECPEIDEREHIENVEVAYDIYRSQRLFGRDIRNENILCNVVVEADRIDQNETSKPFKDGELVSEITPKRRKNLKLMTSIRSVKEKLLSPSRSRLKEKIDSVKNAKITMKSSTFDFRETMKRNLVNKDGHLENTRIIYSALGGTSSEMMAVVRDDEKGLLVNDPKSSDVLIQIEASTVSKLDANIRHGYVEIPNGASFPITPGVDFVGRVRNCGESASIMHGINEYDRVASLCGTGGNSKYISMDASKLVRVPTSIPATSAAIIVESYLAAFQALHLGEYAFENRHSPTSLTNMTVLVFGGISSIGQAIIELALLFNASKVYSTGLPKHHNLLKSLGAIPLGTESTEWLPIVCEQMNIVIDPYHSQPTEDSRHSIKAGGKIICFDHQNGEHITKRIESTDNWFSQYFIRSSTLDDEKHSELTYDVFNEWESHLEIGKSDLSYLFGLLKNERIEPQVARTLKLSKVPDAHHYLDGKRRIQGTFVCVPWEVRGGNK